MLRVKPQRSMRGRLMTTSTIRVLFAVIVGLVGPSTMWGQASPAIVHTFSLNCSKCHDAHSTPDRAALMRMTPEAIYDSLASGKMATYAKTISDTEKKAIAEFLSGRPVDVQKIGDAANMKNHCGNEPLVDPFSKPMWNGWGADMTNSRFQPASAAGLSAEQVPKLTLKWAFGFPNATSAYGQPTVAGGRLYVGSNNGYVYALNAENGCVYWSFEAKASVRSAISIGPPISNPPQYALYVGDVKANVYALSAVTGKILWTQNADATPGARITAAPTLFAGHLYVAVSSWEAMGRGQDYECCKFRGSVVAYDAATGMQLWRTYTIAAVPQRLKTSKGSVTQWGPSGGAVWNSPTVDEKRRLIYVGTGDSYTSPPVNTTDAIIAINLDTGKLVWSRQLVDKDVGDTSEAPDFDIGSSVILRKLGDGHDILVVSQKSGTAYGLDPDHEGKPVWKQETGQGSRRGGTMWGSAADDNTAYIPNVDTQAGPAESGGLSAVRLDNGAKAWHVVPPIPNCREKVESCVPGQSAAVTVIPGAVFSGTTNGILRAYSTVDGHVLWEFDAMGKSFSTVNGVDARGGSFNGPGPTVVSGMLFVNSGYGYGGDIPGNVLLAFGVD